VQTKYGPIKPFKGEMGVQKTLIICDYLIAIHQIYFLLRYLEIVHDAIKAEQWKIQRVYKVLWQMLDNLQFKFLLNASLSSCTYLHIPVGGCLK
jgi:hypothetical protein